MIKLGWTLFDTTKMCILGEENHLGIIVPTLAAFESSNFEDNNHVIDLVKELTNVPVEVERRTYDRTTNVKIYILSPYIYSFLCKHWHKDYFDMACCLDTVLN